MKTFFVTGLLLVLLLAGCQKPTEVQLVDDETFDVEQVVEPDPTASRSSVDSTGLLPKDQERFAGLFMVTSVKTDNGNGIDSYASAYAVLENRSSWVSDSTSGRRRFVGVSMGIVTVNDTLMFRIPRVLGNQSAGDEYYRNVASFSPRLRYIFRGTGALTGAGPFAVAVNAPTALTVQAPAGGAQVPRGNDLRLQWTGQGEQFGLVLSALRLESGQVRRIPILAFKPKKNLGHAMLSKTILSSLPRGAYLLTFAIANRDEFQVVSRYTGKVLIQAASIYNVRIDLK